MEQGDFFSNAFAVTGWYSLVATKEKTHTHHTEKQGETDERKKEQGSSLSNPFDVRGRCYSLGTCRGRKIRTEDNKKTKYVEKLTVVANSDLYSPSLFINRTEHGLTSNVF